MTDRSLTSTETRFARRQIVYRMTQRATSTTASHFNQPLLQTQSLLSIVPPCRFPPCFFCKPIAFRCTATPNTPLLLGPGSFVFPGFFGCLSFDFGPRFFQTNRAPLCRDLQRATSTETRFARFISPSFFRPSHRDVIRSSMSHLY